MPKRVGGELLARGSSQKRSRKVANPMGSFNSRSHQKSIEDGDGDIEVLKERFLKLFADQVDVTNSVIKQEFGDENYKLLVPYINQLLGQSRLTIERAGNSELIYRLNSKEKAMKYQGLDQSHRLVLQVIEKAGDRGIWTKDIRYATSLTEQALKKIYKTLEIRKIVKPIYAVTAARRKLYMLYELTPAREITGGPWYTEMEFDHEFIAELRMFILHCVRNLNGGKGITLGEISRKMDEMKVSRVRLNMEEVVQLTQTLVYDHLIEQESVTEENDALFVIARKVTPVCDFQGWQVLSRDFHFRRIKFDDGIVLKAHEPHYHHRTT